MQTQQFSRLRTLFRLYSIKPVPKSRVSGKNSLPTYSLWRQWQKSCWSVRHWFPHTRRCHHQGSQRPPVSACHWPHRGSWPWPWCGYRLHWEPSDWRPMRRRGEASPTCCTRAQEGRPARGFWWKDQSASPGEQLKQQTFMCIIEIMCTRELYKKHINFSLRFLHYLLTFHFDLIKTYCISIIHAMR